MFICKSIFADHLSVQYTSHGKLIVTLVENSQLLGQIDVSTVNTF